MTDYRTYNVLIEVFDERKRQDEIWGKQNHTPMEWLPILMEEVGEASKAALEEYFNEYVKAESFKNYRTELIHVAAVAIAMIESFDRNEGRDRK